MTIDERLRLPCGICGKPRNGHIGKVLACFGGYGTYWNPDGKRDKRVWPPSPQSPWPEEGVESFPDGEEPPTCKLCGEELDEFNVCIQCRQSA